MDFMESYKSYDQLNTINSYDFFGHKLISDETDKLLTTCDEKQIIKYYKHEPFIEYVYFINRVNQRVGQSYRFYRDGVLRSEYTYFLGKKYGNFVSYYSNGQIKTRGYYVDDKLSGPWVLYYLKSEVPDWYLHPFSDYIDKLPIHKLCKYSYSLLLREINISILEDIKISLSDSVYHDPVLHRLLDCSYEKKDLYEVNIKEIEGLCDIEKIIKYEMKSWIKSIP